MVIFSGGNAKFCVTLFALQGFPHRWAVRYLKPCKVLTEVAELHSGFVGFEMQIGSISCPRLSQSGIPSSSVHEIQRDASKDQPTLIKRNVPVIRWDCLLAQEIRGSSYSTNNNRVYCLCSNFFSSQSHDLQ